jgi:heat shock protein HslJ
MTAGTRWPIVGTMGCHRSRDQTRRGRAVLSAAWALALVGLLVLATACGEDADDSATTGADDGAETEADADAEADAEAEADVEAEPLGLEGTSWALVPDDQLGVPAEGVAVTASFEDGAMTGFSGCNQFSTAYELDETSLSVSEEIAATMMACPEAETEVEMEFFLRLPGVASYTIEDGVLTLVDGDDAALLVFEAVDGAEALLGAWDVTSYYTTDAITSVVGEADLTAAFGADGISGSGGCNTFNGPYEVDGESITIGPLVTTMAACSSEELQQQETDYLAALELATTYTITGTRLDLLRPGGPIAVTFERAD